MFSKKTRFVWIGILMLSGMFLLGHDGWEPPPIMVEIPGGGFDMGDSFAEGDSGELPVHQIFLASFEIDIHEVTNIQYAGCVASEVCTPPAQTSSRDRATYYGDPDYDLFPVIYVSWEQARDYCMWAGKRLPTEAEWERAARGGLEGKRYPWGDTISGTDANYLDSGDPWDNDTSQVGYYSANGYGVYDMAGNVYEWVADWYNPDYYQYCVDNGIIYDPAGPPPGTEKVMRGGSYGNSVEDARVASRQKYGPHIHRLNLGFRCAR